jgi:hypothetical protein
MRLIPLLVVLPVSAALLLGCDANKLVEPSIPTAGALAAAASGREVAAPSNANAVATSETQIDVSWQDNSGNETKFEVHRSLNGENGTFDLRATVAVNVAAFSDQSLQAGTQYCYKIRAVRVNGVKASYSEFSNAACAATLTPPPPPPPPPPPLPNSAIGTDAIPFSSSYVYVSWADWSTNEDGFRIERSTDGGASWSSAATVPPNTYSFGDPGLQSEQQVCYRVVTFNVSGDAPPSNTDCTTPPAAPTNLVAIRVDSQTVDLTWSDNSAVEDAYEVVGRYGYWADCDAGCYWEEYEYPIAQLPPNSTTLHCGGCVGIPIYVKAKKDGGDSGASNEVTVAP